MGTLTGYVHVLDKAGEHHVFGPRDDLPDWAVQLITNPAAWAGEPPQPTEKPLPEGDPALSWTGDQLKQFAEDRKIDLGDAKTKPKILAAIEAVTKNPGFPDGEPDDTWSLDELTRFAAARSIDLGEVADNEDDVLAAIVLALEDQGGQGQS